MHMHKFENGLFTPVGERIKMELV